MKRRVIGLIVAASLGAGPALAVDTRPYVNETQGYKMEIPEGWSDVVNGSTSSPDGYVRCTISAQANPRTVNTHQDEINNSLKVYTAEVWKKQFFTGGATGVIETTGITRLEQFDAPWARGTITYPGSVTAKFGVLMIQGPGRIASVTCTGDPNTYDKRVFEVGKILNYLRPL